MDLVTCAHICTHLGWKTHEIIGIEESGWGRHFHKASEEPYVKPSAELRAAREQAVRAAVPTSRITLTMNNGDVYQLGDIAKQHLVEEATKNGLCKPKNVDADGEIVDMAADEIVTTSADRELLFMQFMMHNVLTLQENVQHRYPQYHLKPMKTAYVNVIKSFIPSYEGDPTAFGPDVNLDVV
jgi:hypothetical protein